MNVFNSNSKFKYQGKIRFEIHFILQLCILSVNATYYFWSFFGLFYHFFYFWIRFSTYIFFNSNITVKTWIVYVWICCNIIVTANVKFYSTNADRLFSTIQEILYLVTYIYLCQNIFFFLKKPIEILNKCRF